MRWIQSLTAGLLAVAGLVPAYGGTYTIVLKPDDADGRTDALWTKAADGTVTVSDRNSYLGIQTGSPITYRSLMEFNLGSIPSSERVVSATLLLSPFMFTAQTLFALGFVQHMAVRAGTGHPTTDYTYEELALGPTLATIFPQALSLDGVRYDVTSGVTLDLAAARSFSSISLAENLNRGGAFGSVQFGSEDRGLLTGPEPSLVIVTTPVPEPGGLLLMGFGVAALLWQKRRSFAP